MKDAFVNIKDTDIFTTSISLELEVPDEMPKHILNNRLFSSPPFSFEKEMLLREAYIKLGMWGFVSWRWITPFRNWIGNRKCLEIAAGRGWLSHALKIIGTDIIATDDFSWHKEKFKNWNNTMTEVIQIDAINAIKEFGTEVDIVIVSWPCTDDNTYKALKELHKINKDALFVFIGEWNSSVSASNNFYDHFLEIEDADFQKVAKAYQRWHGFSDHLYLGKYVENKYY